MIGYVYRNHRYVPIVPVDEQDRKQQAREMFRRMYAVKMREEKEAAEEAAEMRRICPHCGLIKPKNGKCPFCD